MHKITHALKFLKYKAFALGILCIGLALLVHSHLANGMDNVGVASLPLPIAFSNLEKDKELIHQYLSQVKEAELHFFWTTGRTLSDNPTYHPNTKVDVGGAQYGQKFFPYVSKLLEISPNNLKIKFVCDAMTLKSNEAHIEELKHKYSSRFEIIIIEKVHENLLKAFPSYGQIINIVFQNATQGSPVLTSDIYRAIGMIFGQDHALDVTETLYIYSDIDEFCYGIENTSHAQFTNALFKPNTKSPFYFGRSQTNNDVIKLHITDIQAYKNFCERILKKINIHADVLSHFTKLHHIIKQCENDSQSCSLLISQMPKPIKNLMLEVTQTTGPKFLYDQYITTDLSYPDETVGEWTAPEDVLDHTLTRYNSTHPPSVLFWGYGSATPGEEEASEIFMADCEKYRTVLSAAFFAKRFGDHHPFNIAIKQYLIDHFPYHAQSFKNLLKVNFAFYNRTEKKSIRQVYDIKPLESIKKGRSPRKNVIYVSIQDNKLHYTMAGPEEIVLKGTFNLDIAEYKGNILSEKPQITPEELSQEIIDRYKDKIYNEALETGLIHKPEDKQHHLSHSDWKEEAFKNITGSSSNHYAVLTRVLKKLGIEIPFTSESLNYENK